MALSSVMVDSLLRGRGPSLRVVVQISFRLTKGGDTQASQRESGHYCDDYCDDHA